MITIARRTLKPLIERITAPIYLVIHLRICIEIVSIMQLYNVFALGDGKTYKQ